MKILARYALMDGAATVFAACGGSQPQIGAPPANRVRNFAERPRDRGKYPRALAWSRDWSGILIGAIDGGSVKAAAEAGAAGLRTRQRCSKANKELRRQEMARLLSL
ncbi:MAG TPA: hypothetical protein VKR56_00715 [Candidatus Cybelea sp.]|nr:hypothetical protein [Candidatus Cybelea sp.]